jgi:hypothetical protein
VGLKVMTTTLFTKWIFALSAYAAIPFYFLGGNDDPTLFQSLAALITSLVFISACFCYGLYLKLMSGQRLSEVRLSKLQLEALKLTAEPSQALDTLMANAAKHGVEHQLALSRQIKQLYLFAVYGVLHVYLVGVSVMHLELPF